MSVPASRPILATSVQRVRSGSSACAISTTNGNTNASWLSVTPRRSGSLIVPPPTPLHGSGRRSTRTDRFRRTGLNSVPAGSGPRRPSALATDRSPSVSARSVPIGLPTKWRTGPFRPDCTWITSASGRSASRPSHLEPVTPAENGRRCSWSPSTINATKTHCIKGHEYTPENTFITKRGARRCRTCQPYSGLPHWQTLKTHCPQGHPYEGRNVIPVPTGGRACRACMNERSRKWRARKAAEARRAA